MPKAYLRARSAPGGQKRVRRGFDAVVPAAMEVLADADPAFVRDVDDVTPQVAAPRRIARPLAGAPE
jgi:TetR/AcrR family transcriptional regulator, cholesterol catabolism regulator